MTEASSTQREAGAQQTSLSGLGKLTAIALVLFGLSFIYIMVVLAQAIIPPLVVFTVGSLIIAGVVWRGWRWAPLLGAVWFAVLLALNIPIIVNDLSNPAALHAFIVQLITTGSAVVGLLAGIGATVQNYRNGATTSGRVR